MSAKKVVEQYFDAVKNQKDWQRFLSDSITFTSFTYPPKQVAGRTDVVKATQRFYSSIQSMQVRTLIAEEDAVCALTRYELRAPNGTDFSGDVAEIFHITRGLIDEFSIYFDSAPYK